MTRRIVLDPTLSPPPLSYFLTPHFYPVSWTYHCSIKDGCSLQSDDPGLCSSDLWNYYVHAGLSFYPRSGIYWNRTLRKASGVGIGGGASRSEWSAGFSNRGVVGLSRSGNRLWYPQ